MSGRHQHRQSVFKFLEFTCSFELFVKDIIDALLRAFNDGMDVITLSLGGSDGWTESPQAVVAQKLAARGKV